MQNIPAVRLMNVTKKIGNKTIVQDLTYDIRRGEVFGLLGPNGAGKTTTIRMMVGLMNITQGQIMIQNRNVTTDFQEAIKHVGAIVENPEMYTFLSGYQNLEHFANMMKGVSKERMAEVVALVNLTERINDKVSTYSLGMKQRLGVAQALLHRPSVLILDEPTNGLDPAGIRELRDYLRELAWKEDVAVIVSSHLLAEMELMCDRIAVIQKGRIIDVKKVKDFLNDTETHRKTVFQIDDKKTGTFFLKQRFPELEVAESELGIVVQAEQEMVAEINASLVKDDFKVYAIQTAASTLEDRFLEVTGGRSHV